MNHHATIVAFHYKKYTPDAIQYTTGLWAAGAIPRPRLTRQPVESNGP